MPTDVWARVGIWLALAFAVAMLRQSIRRFRDVGRDFEPAVEPEVKTYPEGCTCIRGALLDNPRCPHHGCSWCGTVDPGCREHSGPWHPNGQDEHRGDDGEPARGERAESEHARLGIVTQEANSDRERGR